MEDEKLLVEFIYSYLGFKISDEDFESGLKNLIRPDTTQTKAFYINAFGLAVLDDNFVVQSVLNIIIFPAKDIERNISNISLCNPQLRKCLEMLSAPRRC